MAVCVLPESSHVEYHQSVYSVLERIRSLIMNSRLVSLELGGVVDRISVVSHINTHDGDSDTLVSQEGSDNKSKDVVFLLFRKVNMLRSGGKLRAITINMRKI